MSSAFASLSKGTSRMSWDVVACTIEAVGTAPPRKAASAEPSASMSTAPAWVLLSGVNEELPASSGGAGNNTFSREVANPLDTGISWRDKNQNVWRHRYETAHGIGPIPTRLAPNGEIGDGRVRESNFELPALEAPDALQRAFGGFGRDRPPAILVEHLGERPADDEKSSARRRASNTDELARRFVRRRASDGRREKNGNSESHDSI